MPPGPTGTPPSDSNGLKIAGAVIGGLLLLAYFSSSSESDRNSDFSAGNVAALSEMAPDAGEPPPAPVEPLSQASITRGTGHFRLATNAEGLLGARIYSENCYAALSRNFSWARLDQCGAFDAAAARAAEDVFDGPQAVLDYFGSEAAATRYLRAATGAGAAPGAADERLASLAAALPSRRVAQPALEVENLADLGDESLDSEAGPFPVANSSESNRASLDPAMLDARED